MSALPQEISRERPYSRASEQPYSRATEQLYSRAFEQQRYIPTPLSRDEFAGAPPGPRYQTPLPARQSPQLMNGNAYPPSPATRTPDLRPPAYQTPHSDPAAGAEPATWRNNNTYEAFRPNYAGNGYPAQHMDSAPQTAPPAVEAGKEIIIALMGVTGAGKSYFIRKISGLSEVEVGDGLESCTATIKPYSFTYEGTKITLVDTPGFNDTHRSDTDVLKDIVAWTSQTYKEKRLLSGIIYLHRITDVRMEGSALKNLRMFKSLCGEDALHNVLLTTTQWSRVDPREGEARELELKTKKEFWKPLLDRGATLARFYGDRGSGLELIHKLMAREPKVLDIQEQIVDKKMDLIDTSAGQTINEELIRLQKKYAEELKSTKQELQAALESKDEELKEMLAEQQDREERRLAKIEAERKELLAKHETEIKKRDEEMRKRDEESRKELKELYAAQQKREEALRAESAKKDEERKKLDDEYRRQLWDAQQKRDEAYRAEAARKEEHYKWQMEEQRRQNEADRRERMEIAKSISNEQHRAGLLEQQLQSERERRAQLEMQALETRNRLTMLERRPRGFRDVLFGR